MGHEMLVITLCESVAITHSITYVTVAMLHLK